MNIRGLHHVTALSSDAAKNAGFYAGILGLRMVKKTVNFDAPDTWHLYYGDEAGQPGTIMTFFPIEDLQRGRKGTGQLTVTSFSVAPGSLDYWYKRLNRFGVPEKEIQQRFGDELFLYFEDYDGLGLELVENPDDRRMGYIEGNIPEAYAIKGFHTILLSEESSGPTENMLVDVMNFTKLKEQGNRARFAASDKAGSFVDIIYPENRTRALQGSGTVHHVAFDVENDEAQLYIRNKLISAGYHPSPVVDRNYFHSVYFREPGNVLFEIATSDIGFTVDEDLKTLGTQLKLPEWAEKDRRLIESRLQPVEINAGQFVD